MSKTLLQGACNALATHTESEMDNPCVIA